MKNHYQGKGGQHPTDYLTNLIMIQKLSQPKDTILNAEEKIQTTKRV